MNAFTPFPTEAAAVVLTSTDHDCTGFALGYARRLYIGSTGDVVVKYRGASGNITYKNVPVGYMDGAFITVVKSGTTASLIVAES